MRVRGTMLLTSWPLRWPGDAAASGFAVQIGKLLDPSLPGTAAIGMESGRETTDWLDSENGRATLVELLREAEGGAAPALNEARWIFVDEKRLRAATLESASDAGGPDRPWTGAALQLKWVEGPFDGRVLLCQLRVFDRWPVASRFAPPPPAGVDEHADFELDHALTHLLGPASYAKRLMRELMEGTGLQPFRAANGDGRFASPTLFYIAPRDVPESPESYFGGPLMPFVKRATRQLLGVDDPRAERVAAGFLEGNLLMLRSESDRETSHLLLPCLLPGESWEDVEADLAFVADEWTLEEFRATQSVLGRGFFQQASDSLRSVDVLEAALSRVPVLMVAVRSLVAQPGPAKDTTEPAFRITERLNALLSRLRHELFIRTEPALHISSDLDAELVQARERFASIFTVRDLPGSTTLLSHVGQLPTVRGTRHTSLEVQRRAERLRTALDAYRETLSAVLEQQRQEQRDRTERAQTVVGIAVAALAGVTAVPLIVGQFDPGSLQSALGRLPGPLGGMQEVLHAATPWIGAGSMAGAIGLMGFLGFALWRPARARRSVEDDGVAIAGRVLGRLARDSMTLEEPLEKDQQVSEALVEAIDSLRRLDRRAAAGDLEAAVEALIVRAEIGARRPVPFRLPMAAALIRYLLEPAAPGTWLGGEEIAETLNATGWPADSFERLEAMSAEAHPRQFLANLQAMRTARTKN